jgi:hypothetical protein
MAAVRDARGVGEQFCRDLAASAIFWSNDEPPQARKYGFVLVARRLLLGPANLFCAPTRAT